MKTADFFHTILMLVLFAKLQAQDIQGIVTHESINGANDGAVNITMTGGYPPYTFEWSGPSGFTATTEDINGLKPGSYCVTATDNLCATVTYCGYVRICDPVFYAATWVNCPYNTNGAFALLLSGQGPFSLVWNDGFTQQVPGPYVRRDGLNIGQYCVTVTNAAGCSETVCKGVFSSIEPIQVNSALIQPTCGYTQGAIDLTVTGGVSPYTYQWSDNVQTEDRTNLNPGNYCVTITDKKSCTQTRCVNITPVYNNLSVGTNTITMNSDCEESRCSGQINTTPTGGTPPYSYNWSGPSNFTSNQEDIDFLCNGYYDVTLSDQNGCTTVKSYEICCCSGSSTSPNQEGMCNTSPIQINGQVSQITSSQNTGAINLFVSAGSSYSLVWRKNGQVFSYSNNISNLSTGTYCVTVNNGCASLNR
jgi:hypothetical protein